MRVLSLEELKLEKQQVIDSIIKGAIFIYPTDTIYGIGCNAEISGAVKKIRRLKRRMLNPFSVIAPSLDWINKNCISAENEKDAKKWLDMLPGPYTLILKLKNSGCVAKEVNPRLKTLGVRIPNHWIRELIAEAEVPVVTTSVNRSGEDYMTSLESLEPAIKSGIDFVLYEGEKNGKPSKIFNLAEKILPFCLIIF